ncbi:hypothetical protein BH10PSE9_BH10PSE9_01090 [soil metagenome]
MTVFSFIEGQARIAELIARARTGEEIFVSYGNNRLVRIEPIFQTALKKAPKRKRMRRWSRSKVSQM